MEKKIGNVILDYEHYPQEDLYTDGAAEEDKLLSIAKTCRPSEYNHVIAKEKDWAVMYHFSNVRENILRWYPFTGSEKVLEIGAGCGAVTGILSECCERVDCVELSEKRSLVNAYRHRDRENIRILLGNFQDIETTLENDYDVITLVGVLEYARLYIDAENPYEAFLAAIGQHLAPGGRVFVAIENRLGMKYWAGCTEDHSGTMFDGIEGYSPDAGVRTFSKPELEALFSAAGYSDVRFYYPYPDYKFPIEIFSDDYLPKPGMLNQNMNNFDRARWVLFDEARAYDAMSDSALFPLFSNSYLCVLSKQK